MVSSVRATGPLELRVWPIDPLVKVFRDAIPAKSGPAVAEVARGESATLQVVVRADQPINGLRAQVSPFKRAWGVGALQPQGARFVGYVPVDRPTQKPSRDQLRAPPADYPDPLLESTSVDVVAGQAQPIWITVSIPTNAAPGTYRGTLKLSATIAGRLVQVEQKLAVVVYGAIAGPAQLWVTEWYGLQWSHMQIAPQPESDQYYALLRRYARNMAEHRHNVALISPLALAKFTVDASGTLQIDFARFDKWVEIFQREGVIGRIEGGHIGGRKGGWESEFVVTVHQVQDHRVVTRQVDPVSPEAHAFYSRFFPALVAHLKSKHWLDFYLQHLADEPIAQNIASYRGMAALARQYAPELRIIEACHTKDLVGSIDVWVPQLNYLHEDWAHYQARQRAGEEVWFYTCVFPQGEYANRFLEQPLIKTRLLHWINARYGVTGYLHWGYNQWTADSPFTHTTAAARRAALPARGRSLDCLSRHERSPGLHPFRSDARWHRRLCPAPSPGSEGCGCLTGIGRPTHPGLRPVQHGCQCVPQHPPGAVEAGKSVELILNMIRRWQFVAPVLIQAGLTCACLLITGPVDAQDAAPPDRNAINTRAHPGEMMADSPVTFPKEGALPAKYPPDVRAQDEPAEKDYYIFSSPCRSLAQIGDIQAAMAKGEFTPPPSDWAYLQRTRRILTDGGELRLLALGDSIVNDTMRSGWVAKLAEAYPQARIRATVYVRGGGGCQHYKELERIAKNVIPRNPNLVFIGGISQKDIESIREVIHQLRSGLPEVEVLLAAGAFGTVDPRDPEALAKAPHSGTGAYGQALRKLAAEERCAYLDMTTPWAEYIRSAKVHPHLFYRDVVHANEYGEQILSKILIAFWAAAEPVLHNPFALRGYYLTFMRMPIMGLPEWKQAIDCFAEDQANVVILWTAGGFRSKKFPVTWAYNQDHANVRNDFMRELIDYAHTKNIRVLLGFTPFGYDGVNRLPIEHPELKARKQDGSPVDPFGIHCWGWNLCPAKPESQQLMREYISEMVFEFYPNADGLLIESSDYGFCQCAECGPRYYDHEFAFVRWLSDEVWQRNRNALILVYPHYFTGKKVPGLEATGACQPFDPRWGLFFTPHSAHFDAELIRKASNSVFWSDAPALGTPRRVAEAARIARQHGVTGFVPSFEAHSYTVRGADFGVAWGEGRQMRPFGLDPSGEGRMPYRSLLPRVQRFACREFSRDPELDFGAFQQALGEHVFGSKATAQNVADLLELQRIWTYESDWCWSSPLLDPEFFRRRARLQKWPAQKLADYERHLSQLKDIVARYTNSRQPAEQDMARLAGTIVQRWGNERPTGTQSGNNQ